MRHTAVVAIGLGLAACTGDIENMGGGPPPPPPPATDVQIKVQDGGSPQAGVRVLFQGASGVQEVPTDSAGIAKADMPDGGNVTVIRTYPAAVPPQQPMPDEVLTYIGVKAGDRLNVGHQTALGTPAAINVVVPSTLQGTVTVMTPCGQGTGTAPNIPITVTGCPAMMDFYVTDQNQSYVYARMPYASNTDLSTQPLADTLQDTFTATNVQPGTTVTAELRIVAGNFVLHSSGPQQIDQNPANVNLPNLQGGLEELLIGTMSSAMGNQMVSRRNQFEITPKTFDASVGIIPYVSTPMYTPTQITWMEQGQTGGADFAMWGLSVTPQGTQTVKYVRGIVAPHSGTTLAIPQLTGADAKYNPTATDTLQGGGGLVGMTGGYDAARVNVFAVPTIVDIAPKDGIITYSYAR